MAAPGGRKRGDEKKSRRELDSIWRWYQSPGGVTSCSGLTPKVSCPRLPPKDARTAWQAVSGCSRAHTTGRCLQHRFSPGCRIEKGGISRSIFLPLVPAFLLRGLREELAKVGHLG